MTTEQSTADIQVWSQKKKRYVDGQETEVNNLEEGIRSATKKTQPTSVQSMLCRPKAMKECGKQANLRFNIINMTLVYIIVHKF